MNREIKFRFWDGEKMHITDFHITCFGITWMDTDDRNGSDEERILMQFTGLKDKNGVEIYEGDIIDNGTGNYKGVVTFDNGSFLHRNSPLGYFVEDGVIEDNRDDPDGNITLQIGDTTQWAIVIGNVHQNPELI
jgi:uncharacterized phage protein (TIGR01671 family)